jgi:hypothetical protein
MDIKDAGSKGGKVRAKRLTKKQRSEIARLGGLQRQANRRAKKMG